MIIGSSFDMSLPQEIIDMLSDAATTLTRGDSESMVLPHDAYLRLHHNTFYC